MGSCGGALEVRGRRFAPKVPMTILSQLTDVADPLYFVCCTLPLNAMIGSRFTHATHCYPITASLTGTRNQPFTKALGDSVRRKTPPHVIPRLALSRKGQTYRREKKKNIERNEWMNKSGFKF